MTHSIGTRSDPPRPPQDSLEHHHRFPDCALLACPLVLMRGGGALSGRLSLWDTDSPCMRALLCDWLERGPVGPVEAWIWIADVAAKLRFTGLMGKEGERERGGGGAGKTKQSSPANEVPRFFSPFRHHNVFVVWRRVNERTRSLAITVIRLGDLLRSPASSVADHLCHQ